MQTIYDARLLLVDDTPELLDLLCEHLRAAGYHSIATAADCRTAREAFAAFGLGLGADDYLTKPFLMQELLLRVEHILQRAYRAELQRGAAGRLRLGDRTVELADALVRLPDGSTLPLTATERALLQKLAENRGHIITYDALYEAVWGPDSFGYENSLNVHMRHLREKIEENASKPRWLLTVRGIGYKLAGEGTR